MRVLRRRFVIMLALASAVSFASAGAEEYDKEPIRYGQTEPQNAVSRLIESVRAKKVRLKFDARVGYLSSVLEALRVPESSQTLVYSKTSLQRDRISPRTPRALYFNDEAYVGYCQKGDVLELSVADPKLGTVFYTLDQEPDAEPRFVRQTDNCLICHGSSQTGHVPGHLIRSVFVHPSGLPILSAGTYRTNQASPLAERWGGWYVTGTHGPQKHLGNLVIETRDVPDDFDNTAGLNVVDLGDRFDATPYLSKHSDIVALMVLEHQAEAHNLITQANFATRQALHYQDVLNRDLGEPSDHVWDSVQSRIRNAGEKLVEYLLFCDEAKLTHRIAGTSSFAEDFAEQGPRDRLGRSLRDLDLERRLFRYPCSYLIYSPAFQSLPDEVRTQVVDRLGAVLSGKDDSKRFAHLTPADRRAIFEILRDTLPDLPKSWGETPVAAD